MERLNLSNEQLDVLREIGTIGAGSAATALSQILARKVSITVPQIKLLTTERITTGEFLLNPEEVTLAVELKILGALGGTMLVLFSQESALQMIDILMKRPIGTTQLINIMEASALSESAHILSGSYLNAVGEMLQLHQLIPSIPHTVVDRLERLNQLILKRLSGENIQYFLPIENNLKIEDIAITLFVIFLLDEASIRKILKIVGI
ncbi:MAG: chemotaxis protein CheC [Candidatus Omnitrophica bacterium]|nr:chemotaxis protein CheC [Candidatus Omnitrophota bacterium]